MSQKVLLHDKFAPEFAELPTDVQDELLAYIILLQKLGYQLKRPHADTLKGSKHSNMKELRFEVKKGVWRVAYAFDPKRQAILLVAGNKAGVSQKRFYKQLINKADRRFSQYLRQIKG